MIMKYLIPIITLLLSSCFGPVDPTHPLDDDTSIEEQARSSLHLTIELPMVAELKGYVSLLSSHAPNDLKRLYLEDFNFEGNVTYSDGNSLARYSNTVSKLAPGIYAMYSFIPGLQLVETPLFELNPGSEFSLDLTMENIP